MINLDLFFLDLMLSKFMNSKNYKNLMIYKKQNNNLIKLINNNNLNRKIQKIKNIFLGIYHLCQYLEHAC